MFLILCNREVHVLCHCAYCPVNFNLTLQRLLQWFVHFLPTYNHQIQQWFATLPLLQLGLDVDRLLALSRGAAWSRSGRGLLPIWPLGRSLGTLGRGLRGCAHGGAFRAPAPADLSGGDTVLPCAEEGIRWTFVSIRHVLCATRWPTWFSGPNYLPWNVEAHRLLLARDGHAGHFG